MPILHALSSRDYQTFDQNHHQTTTNYNRPLPTATSIILHLLTPFHLAIISDLNNPLAHLLVLTPSTTNHTLFILNLFTHPDCIAIS
jgi:hypothetical protein